MLRELTASWDPGLRFGWADVAEVAKLAAVPRRTARHYLAKAVEEGRATTGITSWRAATDDDGRRWRWLSQGRAKVHVE